jgi:hypothetical protein
MEYGTRLAAVYGLNDSVESMNWSNALMCWQTRRILNSGLMDAMI